jgi:hypothetical protein
VEYRGREHGVFNASEMVAQIREVEALGKDLFVVVGKVPVLPALGAGMAEWGECPELGPIGKNEGLPDHGCLPVAMPTQLGLGSDGVPAGRSPQPDQIRSSSLRPPALPRARTAACSRKRRCTPVAANRQPSYDYGCSFH